MGYSTDRSGRLCCDSCGTAGGVRKRTCTQLVTLENGHKIPYCPAPAYCAECFKAKGGSRGVHGETCREGAARSSERYAHERARLEAGDLRVRSAFGSWHETVPEGYAGVIFQGLDEEETYRLIPIVLYDQRGESPFLSDLATSYPWCGPLGNASGDTESDAGPLVRVPAEVN
jgi:hypothetical protein